VLPNNNYVCRKESQNRIKNTKTDIKKESCPFLVAQRFYLCVYGSSGKFEPLTHKADLIDIGWTKVLALCHKDAFIQVGGVSVE